jgi:hypothetical protein
VAEKATNMAVARMRGSDVWRNRPMFTMARFLPGLTLSVR